MIVGIIGPAGISAMIRSFSIRPSF